MRRTFVVGRVSRTSTEIVWVEADEAPSFPGPWRVAAVVRSSGPSATAAH